MMLATKLLLLALLIYWTPKFVHPKTDGFKVANIISNLPPSSRFQVSGLPEEAELASLLNGPYTYLGAGGQCYAFVSSDGENVLKLFKHHLRRVHPLLATLPLPKKYALKRELQRGSREKKLMRDFTSYKLAFERFREATGLLYVQLNREGLESLPVQIIDKIGIAHTIDLRDVEFVLQKRAILAYDYLDSCPDSETAKRAIASICTLIAKRHAKGIYDEDAKIHRNFGFIDGEAMIIDVGRLKQDLRQTNPSSLYSDLRKTTDRMRVWLVENHPELVDTLDTTLEEY
ncbi:MAG: hypothetical protein K940chlam2_00824 [Chlamydiae bacterium]|nr:hypothetical protein [Chlamydiota bacterium]